MAVSIKSEKEIELMRVSCKNLSVMFDELEKIIKPGISTWEINKVGEEIIRDFGCIPNFKNYEGYPASICTSVNEVVVHGIPSKKRILKEGDIISLDAGMIYKGYHSDAARTFAVGEISKEARQLDRVSLKEYVMQKQEIIFMIFQQRFRNMRRALVMELCVSLLAMALAHICMKIRKFQTLRQLEEESACALA